MPYLHLHFKFIFIVFQCTIIIKFTINDTPQAGDLSRGKKLYGTSLLSLLFKVNTIVLEEKRKKKFKEIHDKSFRMSWIHFQGTSLVKQIMNNFHTIGMGGGVKPISVHTWKPQAKNTQVQLKQVLPKYKIYLDAGNLIITLHLYEVIKFVQSTQIGRFIKELRIFLSKLKGKSVGLKWTEMSYFSFPKLQFQLQQPCIYSSERHN